MTNLQTKIPTDTWVSASWDEYIQIIENPAYEKAKGYYYNGRMRIEMSAIGNDHSQDHALVILAASNYAAIKGIPMNARDNCTYRKTGCKESQPDVSYYIGDNADAIPYGEHPNYAKSPQAVSLDGSRSWGRPPFCALPRLTKQSPSSGAIEVLSP